MRSEVCKNCCPHGGAYFDIEHYHFDDEGNLIEKVMKVCRNCGAAKNLRKMKPRPTIDELMKTRSSDAGLNLRESLTFHYFNPNGVVGQKRVLDDRIDAAIEAGHIPGGWALAYGWASHYHKDHLWRLSKLKRPKGWDVRYHIRCQAEETARFTEKLEEALR